MKNLYQILLAFLLFYGTAFSQTTVPEEEIIVSVSGTVTSTPGGEVLSDKAVSVLIINAQSGDTTVNSTYTDYTGFYIFNQLSLFPGDTIKAVVFDDCDFDPVIHSANPVSDSNLIISFEICVPDSSNWDDPSWFTYDYSGDNTFTFNGFSNDNREYYFWDFGDGSTQEGQVVSHQFDSGSTETTIILKTAFIHPFTFDTLGTFFLEQDIELYGCNNSFAIQQEGDYSYTFSGTSNPDAYLFEWDFGDGYFAEGMQVIHTYNASVNYATVSLTTYSSIVGNETCIATSSQFLLLGDCENGFTYNQNGYFFFFTGFSNPEADIYEWDMGDGTELVGQNVSYAFSPEQDQYLVTLTTKVYDSLGDSCVTSSSQWIFLNGPPSDCENSFTYENQNDLYIFSGSSTPEADTYLWDFGDGSTGEGQSVTHLYDENQSGIVTVVLTTIIGDTIQGCTAVSSQEIDLGGGNCENSFSYENQNNLYVFNGLSTPQADIYLWDFGDGSTGEGQFVSHLYDPGIEEVNVTLTTIVEYQTQDSCIATSTQTITLFTINAGFQYELDSLNPAPNTYLFSDTSVGLVDTWLWDFGDGEYSELQNPVHTFAESGSYYVCLTPSNEEYSATSCNVINTPEYFNIGGLTQLDYIPMNSSVINGDTAIAYLFMQHNGVYHLYDTVKYYEYGYYYFTDILQTNYLLKIKLTENSSHYGEYFPAYFGNSPAWNVAAPLIVGDSNAFNYNVNLPPVPEMPFGNGSITGHINIQNLCNYSTDNSFTGIFLKDNSNTLLKYTECDNDGYFSFENLPMGDYIVSGDRINLFPEPLSVSLNDGNPQWDNVVLNFVCENPDGYSENTNLPLQIGEVYPNPAQAFCMIDFRLPEPISFSYSIVSILGEQLRSEDFSLSSGEQTLSIPVSNLRNGCYFVYLRNDTGKLVKQNLLIISH